jgi:L-alanine-DL-glutamate epimerase-like enolase superfamily enzyme
MEIDVERMRAVRDAVGAAVELLIDANQGRGGRRPRRSPP